jgi:ubiquinone/menaquinone biosynthesis C-methylase UbiE
MIEQTRDLKREIKRFWDDTPCGVKSTGLVPGTRAFFESVEAHRYREEFHIPQVVDFAAFAGMRVLEIGGGLGTDGRQFAKHGAHYVDADLSTGSLVLARQGFRAYGLTGHFLNTDAERLPFADGVFDAVYSHGVLHHTPETATAIREVHRVLRPGGRAIIMLYARESAAYWVGVPVLGRLRLMRARQRMGRDAFNRMVALPPEHRGWIPFETVVNNSTDGVGNPLARFYSAAQIRTMFADFGGVRLEKHYFHRAKLPLIGRFLPQPVMAWLGRTVGGYWYVIATKEER